MMKYAEAVDLYKKYYDEYMNDPERLKTIERIGRVTQVIPTIGATLFGTGAGAMAGGVLGISPTVYNALGGKVSDVGLGAAIGAPVGGLLGWLLGGRMRSMQQDAMRQAMRNEAWRYAAMMSGKADPGNTLV